MVIFNNSIDAQNLLVGPDDLPIQFTYCGRDTFSVDIRKPSGSVTQVSTFMNVDLEITLPPEMIYFIGSAFAEDVGNSMSHAINGENVSSNQEVITLSLDDFQPNGGTSDLVRIYIPVRANCKIDQNAIEYDLTYDYIHPTNGPGSGSHSYVSDQVGLASPNIIVIDGLSDYDENDVSEGDVWDRTYVLQNSVIGEYCVDTVYFIDEYSSDIEVVSYDAGTIVDSTSSRVVVMFTSVDFMALIGQERLCKDDSFTFTETVRSVECITSDGQRVSTVTVGVSCTTDPDDLCQNTSRFVTHTYPLADPDLYIQYLHNIGGVAAFPELGYAPSCSDEGDTWTVGYAIINPSTEYKATSVESRWYAHTSPTFIDTSAIYVKVGSNSSYQKWNGPYNYLSQHNYRTTLDDIPNCVAADRYYGDVRFRYPELPPGDTLFVITDLKMCWPTEDQCFTPYYANYGHYFNIWYRDACNNTRYYGGANDRRTRQRMDSPPSTDYSPTILEGEKGCFSFSMNGHGYRLNEFFNRECDQNGIYPYGDPVEPGYEMIIDYNNNYLQFNNDPGDFALTSSIGTTWTPSSLDFSSNPGQITAIFSLPPPYGFGGPANNMPNDCQTYNVNLNGAVLDMKLEGICPVACAGYINSQVSFKANHIIDQCADEANWRRTPLRCNDAPLTVTTVCEFCNPCDGTSVTDFTIRRANYGTRDDDNDRFEDVPNGNIPADPALTPEIASNRYFPGDTATGTFALKVNTAQFDDFAFQYLRFGLPSGDYKAIDVDFTIYDVSTGNTYSFEDVPGTYDNNAAGDELIYNMSPYFLQSYGPDMIPSNFVFEQNDSIVGDFNIQIFENVGAARLQKILNITGFNTTKIDAAPSERYSCNIFFAPVILVGWEHERITYSEATNGCNTEQEIYYTSFFVGPNANGNNTARDQFPYEFRKLNTFKEHRFEIPATFSFQYLRWYYRGDNGGGAGEVAGANWIVDPMYYSIDAATNEVVIDIERLMFETNNQFPTRGPIDETNRFMFRPYFQATCETEINTYNYFRESGGWVHHFEENCDAPNPDTVLIDDSNRYFRMTIDPIVTATNLSPAAKLYTPEACWTVRINAGNNGPRSLFFYYDNPPGSVVDIYQVTRLSDGVVITEEPGDWFKLGNNRNQNIEYEICAYVTACEDGALQGYMGWQCDSDAYPTDIDEYRATGCEPIPLNLLYEPLEEFVQADFIDAGASDTVTLCQPIDFSVVAASVSQASAYNLGAYIVISGGNSPYELLNGEADLIYPYPTGAPVTLDSTNASFGVASSFPPFNGDAYFFDLNNQIDSLPGIGQPPGIPEEDRTLRMDFSLTTNCNTTSGTEIWFYLVYEDACGNKRFTPTKFSKTLVIEGAVVDTLLDWIITMEDEPIDGCVDEVTYQMELTNLSRYTSKGQDQLVLTISEEIDFVTASCPATSDDCFANPAAPTITSTNPGGGQSGFNEIVWDIPPGVEEAESIIMDMTFSVDESIQCGITQFDWKTRASGPAVLCETGPLPYAACNIQINTTNGRPIINIDVEKPELVLDNIDVEGTLISGVGEGFEYDVDVCNSGVPLNAGDTTRINFYYDANSDGMVDAGDILLHTDFKTDPIAANNCLTFNDVFQIDAGFTCGILLEIDPNTCKCNDAVTSIGNFPLVGTFTTESFTICHGDTATIMGEALPGYTYTWIGDTDGLLNPNILNSEVTYTNTGTTSITREYILEIDRNGSTECDGFDTLYVTILPEIDITGTVTNISCNGLFDGAINAAATGGQPPYNYLWSTGDMTNSINGLAVGTYTLTITDDSLCVKEASFEITQPTTLSLGVGSSAAYCGQSDGTATVNATGGTAPYDYSWNTGATSSNLTGLDPGFYYVTVIDDNGCQEEAFIEVGAGGGPAINTSSTNASCGGATDGSASVVAMPASGSYSYSWNTGATTSTITNLGPNLYTVTVTDIVTTCVSIANITISEGGDISLLPNVIHPSCGASDGATSVSINGGQAPYTYLWDDTGASTTTGLTNIAQGGYCVTITDAQNCTATTCMNIIESCCDLDVSDSKEDITCSGGADGEISLTVNMGTAPFNYTWSHTAGLNGPIASGLSAGIYSVTIADANCSTIKYIEIAEAEVLNISVTKTNSKQCDNNNCSGTVDMSLSGGTPPYNYFWTTGASGNINTANNPTNVLTDICQGIYSVTATDANGCEAISSVVISVDPAFNLTFGIVNADCGESNGSIEAAIMDGIPPFTYAWNGYPAETTGQLENLAAGNYTLSVTDGTGCILIRDIYVNNNNEEAPYLASKIVSNTDCGASTGAIDITLTGGTAPFNYAWSNGANTEDILNVIADDYSVTVTDASGCIVQYDFIVKENPFDVEFTYGVPPCNTIEGFIIANGVGGVAPYTYVWDDASTNPNRTDLRSGVFTVTVTDATGCTSIANAELNSTDGPQITGELVSNISCNGGNDGRIDLTITGGTPPYNVLWDNFQTGPNATNLPVGTYTAIITDIAGCKAYVEYEITEPDKELVFQLNPQPYVACNGDNSASIELLHISGTAPYTYAWSDGSTIEDRPMIGAGIQTVSVTDGNGCVAIASVLIEEEPPIMITPVSITDTLCAGEIVDFDISVAGGVAPYTYDWSTGDTSQDILGITTGGSYTVTVTDANDCTTTEIYTLIPSTLDADYTTVPVDCDQDNGSLIVNVLGGNTPYTYDWAHDVSATSNSLTNLAVGTYDLTITDGTGCTISLSVPVDPVPIYPPLTVTDYEICEGESIEFFTTLIADSYSWTGPNGYNSDQQYPPGITDATVADAGTFRLSLNYNDCDYIDTLFNIVVNPKPAQPSIFNAGEVCIGNSVQISTGETADQYCWLSPTGIQTITTDPFLNVTEAGDWTLSVKNGFGCASDSSLPTNVVIHPIPTAPTATTNSPVCVGEALELYATTITGASYEWQGFNGFTSTNQNPIINNAAPIHRGTYRVRVNVNGCYSAYSNVEVIVNENPEVFASNNGGLCGSDLELFAKTRFGTAPYTYAWTTPTGGTLTGENPVIANPDASDEGTYILVVTDANGCSDTNSTVVSLVSGVPNEPVIQCNSPVCEGEELVISTVEFSGVTVSYEWTGPAGTTTDGDYPDGPTITISNSAAADAGNYTVEITVDGCTSFTSAIHAVAISTQARMDLILMLQTLFFLMLR